MTERAPRPAPWPQAPWHARIAAAAPGSKIVFSAPLHKMTTLRIGGPAECLVDVESEAELQAALALALEEGLPWRLLGKGSNVLAPDAGLPGLTLRLVGDFQQLTAAGANAAPGAEEGLVWAGAGLSNAAFVERALGLGLGGMEFLTAIPGSIGGAIAMNAGAHGQETQAFLVAARHLPPGGAITQTPRAALEFGYRTSPLRGDRGQVVLAGAFRLEPLGPEEIRARKQHFQQWRREHQPRDYPNCGSVFKNPPDDFAARLVDQCGLKGHRIGGAQVSEKHANFIVNRGGAKAAEVLALVAHIQTTVLQEKGISLELEMLVL